MEFSSSTSSAKSELSLYEIRPRLTDGFNNNCCFSPKSLPPPINIKWDESDYRMVVNLRFNEQEELLVDDILYCMQGIEGEHIRIDPSSFSNSNSSSSGVRFVINPYFEESIRVLAGRIVPICAYYHVIVRFIERTTSISIDESPEPQDAVRQSFAAAARTIVDDYNLYLVQLDNCQQQQRRSQSAAANDGGGGLTLQKMWYHVQPILRVFKFLADSCSSIGQVNLRGGRLLTFLHSKCEEFAGDRKAQEMFAFLLVAAARPFFQQLEVWLYRGEVIGRKEDFMIVFNEEGRQRQIAASGSTFDEVKDWECRYSLSPTMCPSFLSSAAEKILNSGKYLNIISSCGRKANLPKGETTKLRYTSTSDRRYLRTIDTIYAESGRALVSLLTDDFKVIDRLQSLKHYFLIGRGDWLVHFMQIAEKELNSVVDGIVTHRVGNQLALAFNLSSVTNDPIKDQIGFTFESRALTDAVLEIVRIKGGLEPLHLTAPDKNPSDPLVGFDTFCLQFDAPWPLSIVFHKDAMFKYRIIFRQLFTFKCIERQLSKAWIRRRGKCDVAVLLHALVTFVRKYLHHASVDVIEPYWQRFMESVSISTSSCTSASASFTLDDLLREHNQFLDSCAQDLLLTEEQLVLCVEKIVELCKETVKHAGGGDDDEVAPPPPLLDVEFMQQEYALTVEELLTRMRSLSNNRREKGWLDVAYSLGLVAV